MEHSHSLSPEHTLAFVQLIADTADSINHLNFHTPTDDPEAAQAVLAATHDAVLKIGLIADMLARSMGGLQIVGDAKNWFLPMAFFPSTAFGVEVPAGEVCHA